MGASLIMRRLLVVRLDAFEFQRFHRAGLALGLLFQALQQLALLDDDGVQLLDLMLEVGEVGLQFFGAPGIFVCHGTILPVSSPEVEAVNGWEIQIPRSFWIAPARAAL